MEKSTKQSFSSQRYGDWNATNRQLWEETQQLGGNKYREIYQRIKNNMSYVEDMGIDAHDVPEHWLNEQHWKSGVHYDANDKAHLIREMETSHIENTIKYFSELDTTPLKKELERRNHNNL